MRKWLIFGLAVLFRLILLKLTLIHDKVHNTSSELRVTDLDLSVMLDAAELTSKGKSPYDRPTYRYTPILAYIYRLFSPSFIREFLLLCDLIASFLAWKLCQTRSNRTFALAMLNMFNSAIAVRGNCDVLTVIAVLGCLHQFQSSKLVSGLMYGASVHLKLYPIIYAPTIVLRLWKKPLEELIEFVGGAFVSFSLMAGISIHLTNLQSFTHNSYLYHLTRKDLRHNFSPSYYWIYLLSTNNNNNLASLVGFASQTTALLAASTHKSMPSAFFAQTAIFVAFNKVSTSQYFVWYLYLLPAAVRPNHKLLRLAIVYFAGQAIWLWNAYRLEFLMESNFRLIWISSILNMFATVWCVCHILKPDPTTTTNKHID